jgi:hypothetical protein
VILYRKVPQLRVRRSSAPEPPFWAATALAPYSARRAAPIAIDYLALRASGTDRLEVSVCADVRDELERGRSVAPPVLVDAAEAAEIVFRRGEEALQVCADLQRPSMLLVSTRGTVPLRAYPRSACTIAAFPLELPPLKRLFGEAAARGLRWGVAVPVIFPLTTDLATLTELADAAKSHGASFLAAIPLEVEATAKQAISKQMDLAADDDRYAMLFHSSAEPVQIATERHIAALAAERDMIDFIPPPGWDEKANWNASALLALTAARMMTMELDLDLAGRIARSARIVADLDKPVKVIGESASLSIVGGLDETSVAVLTEWLSGAPASFVELVNEQWRLRRA